MLLEVEEVVKHLRALFQNSLGFDSNDHKEAQLYALRGKIIIRSEMEHLSLPKRPFGINISPGQEHQPRLPMGNVPFSQDDRGVYELKNWYFKQTSRLKDHRV